MSKKINLLKFHKGVTAFLTGQAYTSIPEFHKQVLEIYERDDRLQLVVAPVGFAKSSTLRSLALKNLLQGTKFQLYVSSSASKVAQHFSSFQKFLISKDFQRAFDYELLKCNTEQAIIKKNGQELALFGISGGSDISGINFQSQRPEFILVDDLEELEQANNIERTNKLLDWLETTLISRLPSLVDGKIRMIGTNLSLNSIVNRILTDKVGGWKHYLFQALTEEDKSIWEERHPASALLSMKLTSPSVFARNYQNAPIDTSYALIQEEDLRYYEYVDVNEFDEIFIHADTTHTAKTMSDYFCLGALGMHKKDKRFYLLDFRLEQLHVEKQARSLINFYSRFGSKVAKITYDEKANQGFGHWAIKLAREEYNISLPLQELRYPSDKITHFEPHVSHFKANRIVLPALHPQLQLGKDQLLAFPASGVHDDFVDCLSGLLDNFAKIEIEIPDYDFENFGLVI